jgi:hypothetical protein
MHSSEMHSSEMQDVMEKSPQPVSKISQSVSSTPQHHCNHPGMIATDSNIAMSASEQTIDMQAMNCDAACCDNCLGTPAMLTSLPYISFSHPFSMKPASGKTNLYTHIISPELRPPLV